MAGIYSGFMALKYKISNRKKLLNGSFLYLFKILFRIDQGD